MRARDVCHVCGGSFQAKRRDARLCSPKCRQRAARDGQDARGFVTALSELPPRGRCGHCRMPLDPSRDPYSRGAPVDGHHPECLGWARSGRRHLLLEPDLWGGVPLMMAAA